MLEPPKSCSLCVSWEEPTLLPQATLLAASVKAPLLDPENLPKEGYVLWVTPARLLLELRQGNTKHSLSAEFLTGAMGYRTAKGGGVNQTLARAVGLKSRKQGLTVLDGTAGLGKDGFILATLGCSVVLVERSPILFALLQDGLKRAEKEPMLEKMIHTHLKPVLADFRDYVQYLSPENLPEVVYLDPMFPERSKSALTKMEMRIIRDIVGIDNDAEALLTDALKIAKKRVVVKRPLHAPYLRKTEPDFVVPGKRNRYDVYLTGGNIKIHE